MQSARNSVRPFVLLRYARLPMPSITMLHVVFVISSILTSRYAVKYDAKPKIVPLDG